MTPPLHTVLGGFAKRLGKELCDLIFPRTCLHCRMPVERESPLRCLCVRCAAHIEVIQPPRCTTCGYPFYGAFGTEESGSSRICPHCTGINPAFGEGRACVLLKGPARALVHGLKYQHKLYVLEDMGRLFARSPKLAEWLSGAVLLPVPLHPRRQRERGYNQCQLLAEALAKMLRSEGRLSRVQPLLRRIKDTESQTQHDRQARLASLKKAFALAKGAQLEPKQHYVLVDDVFTTGATLNSCATVLRRAGCQNLDVVTFGHG